LAPLAAGAQMYKCVDESGKVHYTDTPGPGCKESAIKPSPPISGEVRSRPENLNAEDAAFRRRQAERATQEAKETGERKAFEQRCARLRQEHALLSGGRRIVRYDAKGERVYMDDEVRAQRAAQLEQQLRGCP
jgi:hypothetical protein